jgi:DNA-directed RNA polymerase specialized sigma24 family protein
MLTIGRLSAYADAVTHPATDPTDLARDLDDRDPAVGLRAVAALSQLLEQLESLQVQSAREQGWSWQAIAQALGVTRQTVHRKHRRR